MGAIRWVRRGIALAGIGAVGGALFVTARHLLETPQPLQSALLGEGRIDRKHGGDIYYNVAGDESAEPVVLLHDFYPGASNYEYRHIFPHLADAWRVYAPDWLGFGMSEHPSLAYTGEFYANMLIGFLRDVVGRPAVVLGHGRAANIAVRAASDAPDLFTRLILVAPDVEAGIELEPKPTQLLTRATQRVSLGLVPYAFLSTKPLLRRLAHRRSALSGETSAGEDTVAHLYASAHQFGGQHALLALLAGELDLPMQNAFPLLQPPVLIISGDEDPRRPVEMMEELAILNPHADLDVLTSAGEAVFEDQPTMFAEALLDWLATSKQPQVEQPLEQLLEEQAEEIPVLTEETETVIILEAPETTETTDTSESVPGSTATPTEPAVDQPPEQTEARPRSAPTTRPARRTASTSLSAPIDEPKAEEPGARRPQRSTRQAGQTATPRPRSQKADKAEQSGKSEAVSKPRTTKKATGGASSGKSTGKTSNASGQKSGARNANGTTSPEKTSDNKRSRASSRAAREANPNTD